MCIRDRSETAANRLTAAGHGFGVFILPYMEQQSIYDQVGSISNNFSSPIVPNAFSDGSHLNPIKFYNTVIPSYVCPSCPMGPLNTIRPEGGAKSNYVGVLGPDLDWGNWGDPNAPQLGDSLPGILYLDSETAMGAITDGTSNTFVVGERDGATIDLEGTWTRSATIWFGPEVASWVNTCLAPTSDDPEWTCLLYTSDAADE